MCLKLLQNFCWSYIWSTAGMSGTTAVFVDEWIYPADEYLLSEGGLFYQSHLIHGEGAESEAEGEAGTCDHLVPAMCCCWGLRKSEWRNWSTDHAGFGISLWECRGLQSTTVPGTASYILWRDYQRLHVIKEVPTGIVAKSPNSL